MLFRSYIPRGPLRELVEDFWLYEGYAGDHLRERILPSGTFEMVFNLQEDELRIYGPVNGDQCRRFAGALISGPYAGSFMSDTVEEAAILGAHFKPGGAAAVLGPRAGEFANTHVDLRAIWGPVANEIREQLCARTGPAARFQFLEQAITARMADPLGRRGGVRWGLDMLVRTRGRAKVRDVAKAVDLSQRRFIELFTAEVGLTPKLFSRIQRFQHAIARSHSTTSADWAEIAASCGYYDQSHLIRDFIEFSGVSPSDYVRRRDQLDRAGAHIKRYHLPLKG